MRKTTWSNDEGPWETGYPGTKNDIETYITAKQLPIHRVKQNRDSAV